MLYESLFYATRSEQRLSGGDCGAESYRAASIHVAD